MNDSEPSDDGQTLSRGVRGDRAELRAPALAMGQSIGRYRIERQLGSGGFGAVYLAHDDQLKRRVAIKVPHGSHWQSAEEAAQFLVEAQVLANLDHPHIVPVYDVGRLEEGLPYVVSKFIEGCTLADKCRHFKLTIHEVASLVAKMAEALQFAHQKRVVHRDVKPANILLDTDGRPFLADFGLALKEEDFGKIGGLYGTPAYMSPEQASGEGHLVDGRSDIFSLGVVLYELLTGSHPFTSDSTNELLRCIATVEARPLRQLNPTLPQELERITLKALAKRVGDRYGSACDFAADLQHWLEPKSSAEKGTQATSSQRVIPKGLRSFDANDAEFFLELLPGPRDREGLPDSLRFWKNKLEEFDSDQTFRVGVMYGPSGCGKSSLVKAGLLPRLNKAVRVVYLEAAPAGTEQSLREKLLRVAPQLPADSTLSEMIGQLRRAKGRHDKVVIILDQFEQWLHGTSGRENSELIQAIRQCDGGHVQCIVMVRDDFGMALTRFMAAVDTPLVQGSNFAAVDLFDLWHASKVLTAFGVAYGRLPENAAEHSPEQQAFLEQAIADLAHEGTVIPVRLALFADMVKGKPWTQATLQSIGGIEGVGVTFLEETFAARSAPPQHRQHLSAAKGVLKALLPEAGTDLKGHRRSRADLVAAAGTDCRPEEFSALLQRLESDVRLITPIDAADFAGSAQYYQLTHDYLVPSLREWLVRKQKESRRGRAELLLADLASTWNARRENRQLPSLWQWLQIWTWTQAKNWTAPERQMMSRAGRFHGLRWSVAFVLMLLVGVAIERIASSQSAYVVARELENNRQRAATLVESVLTTSGDSLPTAITNLKSLTEHALPLLRKLAVDEGRTSTERLHAACALAELGEVDVARLIAAIGAARPDECANLATALNYAKAEAVEALQVEVQKADAAQDYPLKARLAIVGMYLNEWASAADMTRIAGRTDLTQRTLFIHEFASWHGDLSFLAELMSENPDSALRSGLALGSGGVSNPGKSAKETWGKVLADWHTRHADAVTHSASGWALRQWNLSEPSIAPSSQSLAAKNWMVTKTGLTLIRIPAGNYTRVEDRTALRQDVTFSRDIWFSDREITISLFRTCLEDQDYSSAKTMTWPGENPEYGSSPQHSVQAVSWYDALLFCNWLSAQEGQELCYRLTGGKEKIEGVGEFPAWELIANAHGYRLPTEAEWEYACRAGTTTWFFSGDDTKLMEEYSVSNAKKTELPGSRCCNPWGLFDMHGNVCEWCQDGYGYYMPPQAIDPVNPHAGNLRVMRGGGWANTPYYSRASYRYRTRPSLQSNNGGLRVVLVTAQ
jgi:serine/threonine protein kinase/formylglycine-generating enzyme required for sulfatase activity